MSWAEDMAKREEHAKMMLDKAIEDAQKKLKVWIRLGGNEVSLERYIEKYYEHG